MQPQPLSARFDSRFSWLWRAFWLCWVGTGLVLLALGLWFGLLPLQVLGVTLTIIMGGMFWFSHHRLNDPRPVLQIGPQGYHDRRLGAPIPWSAIREFRRQRAGSRIVLLIGVDHPATYLGNAGLLKGPMQRINPRLGFPALGSMLVGLDHPQDEIACVAEAYWQAAQSH